MFRANAIRSLFLLAACTTIPLLAQTKTDRYIVELSDAPAADMFRKRPHGVRPAMAELLQSRAAVRRGQDAVRSRVEQAGATIHDSVEVAKRGKTALTVTGRKAVLSYR